MWNWIAHNILTCIFFTAFIAALSYALWLRSQMQNKSKAQFALAAIAAMSACATAGLHFLSGSSPNFLVSAFRGPDHTDPNWLILILGTFIVGFVLLLMYLLSSATIKYWRGPITVNVNELAKQNLQDSLPRLAHAELLRLIALKPDPPAAYTAINWKQKISEPPPIPRWHQLARNLFETAFSEARFTDDGWRDMSQMWVGDIYVNKSRLPIFLLVFNTEPDDAELVKRVNQIMQDGSSFITPKLFAVFDKGSAPIKRTVTSPHGNIEVWPRRALLRQGLDLTNYALTLTERFDEKVGGTDTTLSSMFVAAHVSAPHGLDRKPLSLILEEWLKDTSRRQLAITGEYGRGKSTAMLEFCVQWAHRYLDNGAFDERIPLLIELRGKSPSEADPVAFLSSWTGRYRLDPTQVYNLVKAGEAIIIFEGFDELRNAGRAYDRHEHFNALWRMAYPGTKIIFTGRPNFFLDEKEKNQSLRSDSAIAMSGAGGNAFTQLWELAPLTEEEVGKAVGGFGESLSQSIMAAVRSNPSFLEIISRPSMLPVVATIWPEIMSFQQQGYELTGAILIEKYIRATYLRKTQEIAQAEMLDAAPEDASYLLLPPEVRDVFTLLIVWKMVCSDARNTIDRRSFDNVIRMTLSDVFKAFQSDRANYEVTQKLRKFEERFAHETGPEWQERVATEVATAGIFVSDPASGESNLRLPHKQFYEYMIAKVAWTIICERDTIVAKLYQKIGSNKDPFNRLLSEEVSIKFLSEIIGPDCLTFDKLFNRWMQMISSPACLSL